MTTDTWLILLHQLLFQGMFVAKNVVLKRRLGQPIRGFNPEASLSIAFFAIFIAVALWLSLAPGTHQTGDPARATTQAIALLLMLASLGIAAASLRHLGDSWRVGVIEEQRTALIERGIYRFSRNPYFVSYLLMFAAYTTLLASPLLLILSAIGFAMIHAMILREERYLTSTHPADYARYRRCVPRYLGLRKRTASH
ncbi:MAG: isoprenylcysteine carboxylmethyltransferase family protein [Halioglobus sp.]|nr:isoprenylcysteine carboxylmethyltransferase family protein [Halioglobus sp.]